MNATRQALIDRARQLNSRDFDVEELQERIREACVEYLIEARVNVDKLLRHEDWRVRWSALDIVWHGIGATDGIEQSINVLLHDADEDVRAHAALALYEAARGTNKQGRVIEALRSVADNPNDPDYVRTAARGFCRMLTEYRR